MNAEYKPEDHDALESNPSAELGLHNPVRDKAKLGDSQYSVTPPRREVQAPTRSMANAGTCVACSAELDPNSAYRPDSEEYIYHFCGPDCYARWRETAGRDDV